MTSRGTDKGLSVDEAIRALLLLMPRLVGRIRRTPIPDRLRSFSLTPRHLSLLSYLVSDGPMVVNELASRLDVAPTTVSLMVGDLSRQGILERGDDEADRRRTIVSIADEHRSGVEDWLTTGGEAWRTALEPLTPAQRQVVLDTLRTYHQETAGAD
ncbi:MAG: MarR family winged helix-turn-helix transcriptional regulator [Acidimicrobiales bacterium]